VFDDCAKEFLDDDGDGGATTYDLRDWLHEKKSKRSRRSFSFFSTVDYLLPEEYDDPRKSLWISPPPLTPEVNIILIISGRNGFGVLRCSVRRIGYCTVLRIDWFWSALSFVLHHRNSNSSAKFSVTAGASAKLGWTEGTAGSFWRLQSIESIMCLHFHCSKRIIFPLPMVTVCNSALTVGSKTIGRIFSTFSCSPPRAYALCQVL